MISLIYRVGSHLYSLPILSLSIITIVTGLIITYISNSDNKPLLEDDIVSRPLTIIGVVQPNYVVKTSTITYDIKCKKIIDKNEINECNFLVRITSNKYPGIHIGEVIEIVGQLEKPKNFDKSFSYERYLDRKGVKYVMYRPIIKDTGKDDINIVTKTLFNIRDHVVYKMRMYLPEPHASLLSGVLLGVKNTMPEGFSEDLRRTGTTHIIAASGYNVAIIANLLINSLTFISRRLRIVVGAMFVWIFVIISGASIPVVRAAIMISIGLFAILLGRYSNISQTLLFTAAIMFLGNKYIFEDISFQLSFLSTAGLIYLVPIIKKYLSFIPKYLEESVVVTLSAILSTFPITAMNFRTFSIIAPIANILVLPTVEIIMVIGAIFVVIPEFMSPLLKLISLFLWAPLDYFIKVVGLLSGLKFASIEFQNFSVMSMLLCYSILLVLVIIHPKINHFE